MQLKVVSILLSFFFPFFFIMISSLQKDSLKAYTCDTKWHFGILLNEEGNYGAYTTATFLS